MFRNKGSVMRHCRDAKKTFEFFTTKSSVRKNKDVYHGDGKDEEKGGRGGDGRGGEGAIHRKLITGQQQGIDCANNGEWIMTEGSGLMQK